MTIASATVALTAALASGDAAAIRKARRALASAKKAEDDKKMKKAKKADDAEKAEKVEKADEADGDECAGESDVEPEDAKYTEDAEGEEHKEPDGDEEPVEAADDSEESEDAEAEELEDGEESEESEDAEDVEEPKKAKKMKRAASDASEKTPFDKAVRGLLNATSNGAALGKLRALIDAHAQLGELAQKVAKMERDAKQASVEKLVGKAIAAGKIAPTQKAMFVRMGMRDSRELKAYVETAPAIVNVSHAVETEKHVPNAASVSDRAAKILAAMGVSPERAAASAAKHGVVVQFPKA
jgi:cobalamin biosynthesis protein CobT